MTGRVLGMLVLAAWGIAKTPVEIYLTAERDRLEMGGFKLTANLREQAGQAGFLAVLGGLRSAVADMLFIRAHVAWQDVEYGRMKLLFDVCTSLQPRRELFWDIAAWHMAWNGAAYVDRDPKITDPLEREKEKRKFWRLGEQYLRQGTQNVPDSWHLWERLGGLYRDKFQDPYKAARAYEEAAKRPGCLDFVKRFAATFLADCPGYEKEAYDKMLALYKQGEEQWLPTLLYKLQLMERKLGIPKEQRVYIPPKERLPE